MKVDQGYWKWYISRFKQDSAIRKLDVANLEMIPGNAGNMVVRDTKTRKFVALITPKDRDTYNVSQVDLKNVVQGVKDVGTGIYQGLSTIYDAGGDIYQTIGLAKDGDWESVGSKVTNAGTYIKYGARFKSAWDNITSGVKRIFKTKGEE